MSPLPQSFGRPVSTRLSSTRPLPALPLSILPLSALPVTALGLSATLLLASCADEGGDANAEDEPAAARDTTSETEDGEASGEDTQGQDAQDQGSPGQDNPGTPFVVEELGSYDSPWALEFLPGTDQLLITTQPGELVLHSTDTGEEIAVSGVPDDIVVAGQGGLGDVVAAPDFEQSQRVYLSWVSSGEGGTGAVVGHAQLVESGDAAELQDLQVIWQQDPRAEGSGHFSHRLAFSPDGEHLFITSGDRQLLDPAQDLSSGLGKIMRLTPEGDPASGNPFADQGGVTEEIWTYGHRNALGIAFDAEGRLWSSEMGPAGGDELNLIEEGQNYGWPEVSNGSHYDGEEIPDHTDDDGFTAPAASWNPAISPGSLMIYQGELFEEWTGDAFLGALSGEALVRVGLDETSAAEDELWEMDARIRDLAEAPDGSIWLIQDGAGAQLLRLTPAQ
ncbi:PQQ-dependent sugar dehydrogenase [Nesterenkonia massiliensis]|uniref:PQQ-dependent sugar dehydrogenase n=1 Tax=Nesterenkonia massiliensis TaxID=1232429 RepID=A0ABT2HQP2_9MICC|nr:PQQ-dependent sugar dehydrogenase [Nesterenkonia massiliensis]MCT1607011.1 PQQ-dependent sugar dehydrogenase [Nesterenkonia massiliensis]